MSKTNTKTYPVYTPPGKFREVFGVFGRTKALELEKSDPKFPKRVRIGDRLTAWKTEELIDYFEAHAKALK